MPKVLITGGMGFIFSHVTEYFLAKGWEVHVIDNLSAGSHPEIVDEFREKEKFFFHEYDVAWPEVAALITTLNPDYIVHAAAISDVDYSIKHPLETITSNNNATLNVFEAARHCSKLKRILYVSTDEVYGECDHPKTEEEIIFPRNPYALSKAFGSILRLSFDNTYPELTDKTVETRFCNVFGPRQDARKIIPAIIKALNTGEPLPLHNNGEGYRQYIYVKEIPPLIELLLASGHRTYNITSGVGYTVRDLMAMIGIMVGSPVPYTDAGRSGMDMRYVMSSDRLREEFGWQPQIEFLQALKEYLNENLERKTGMLG